MRKKSQDELGTLVTREMKVMLQDDSLTKEQRFDILACCMFDMPLKNTLMASYANSLKAGFDQINNSRYRAIEREREWRKNLERKRRHAGYLDDNGHSTTDNSERHEPPCNSMSLHDGLKQNKTKQGISPYKPPKGGGRKVPKTIEPEDLVGNPAEPKVKGGDWSNMTPEEVFESATRESATFIAMEIEQTEAFAHMRVNRRNLLRHLIPIVKKNCAGENAKEFDGFKGEALAKAIRNGLAAWTEKWAADGWQYAPGKITKWLADEKWLEPPRKKTAPAEGSGCGDCGAEIA